jgi:hypothetical protein
MTFVNSKLESKYIANEPENGSTYVLQSVGMFGVIKD